MSGEEEWEAGKPIRPAVLAKARAAAESFTRTDSDTLHTLRLVQAPAPIVVSQRFEVELDGRCIPFVCELGWRMYGGDGLSLVDLVVPCRVRSSVKWTADAEQSPSGGPVSVRFNGEDFGSLVSASHLLDFDGRKLRVSFEAHVEILAGWG